MTIEEMIRAVQTALGVEVDGKAGPQTWTAIYRRLAPAAPVTEITTVDPRSEANIATLLPQVRPLARSLVQAAKAQGITIKVISGTRTFEQQDALYAQGRSRSGPIVTNARGGYSNHNWGIAFDIGIFDGGNYVPESPRYKAVGSLGVALGLEWGGNWTTIQDEPHFQYRPPWASGMTEREMLAQFRSGRKAFE